METEANKLSERFLKFATEIVRVTQQMKRNYALRYIGTQLLRAGTSVGANYEEARGAESKSDFIHKLKISLKEARETMFWLKVVNSVEYEKSDKRSDNKIESMIAESDEICKILASSIKTVKSNRD